MKTTLYLGTDPTQYSAEHLIHYPVIKIVPRSADHPEIKQAFAEMAEYTHLIFTSKNAVKVFFALYGSVENLKEKTVIAIGAVTASYLSAYGLPPDYVSTEETQEGVVNLLQTLPLENAYIFLPRSSLSRPVLTAFFTASNIRFRACDLYDTVSQVIYPLPDLEQVDEIVFTSPSTVKAFVEIFGALPRNKKCLAIGPITNQAMLEAEKT